MMSLSRAHIVRQRRTAKFRRLEFLRVPDLCGAVRCLPVRRRHRVVLVSCRSGMSCLYLFLQLINYIIACSSLLFTKGLLLAIMLLEGFVMGSAFAGSLLSFLAVPR